MAQLSNYFGLKLAEFAKPAAAVAVPGFVTLKTSPNAPEGVLLKTVSNMTQALDAGGLLMVSRTTPTKWMFLVGKTLELAIRKSKLGVITDIRNVIPCYKFTELHAYRGHEYAPPAHQWIRGGVLTPYLTDKAYFLDTEVVDMIAISTSASEGLGYSTPANYVTSEGPTSGSLGELMQPNPVALGYMASEVPMEGTFENFMRGVKAHAISLVPENIRDRYVTTFEGAMAGFSLKDAKPSITVPTFWQSGLITPLALPTMTPTQGTGLYPPGSLNTTLAWGLITPAITSWGYEDEGMGTDVTTVKPRYLVDLRYGFKGDNSVSPHTFPYMTKVTKFVGAQPLVPHAAGMMEGLNVGLLRDGHVLGRAIIGETRYADQPSTSASLGAYIAGLVDGGTIPDTRTKLYAFDEPNAQAAVLDELQRMAPPTNIFSGGTLPGTIAAFSNVWDTAAKVQ